jgi:shikimate dehydrogenase
MENVLLGLVGAGVQSSLAAALHEEEGRHHGLRIEYRLIDLDSGGRGADALPEVMRSIRAEGFAGVNVTHPCKQSVIPLLDTVSPEAEAIGAVNTVVREGDQLVGYNTDGTGWTWGFLRALPRADLSHVVLLGAGGAGAACADALLRLGAARLVVVDKDASHAAGLVARLNANAPGARAHRSDNLRAALQGATGFVQATPVGTAKMPGLPLPAELLRPSMWVSEIVYRPLETELVKAARRAGCAVVDGGHMNVGQALGAFKLFTGRAADPSRMQAHFRKQVARKENA